MKNRKTRVFLSVVLLAALFLEGCASTNLEAPCDNFGKNCDPKVQINQWTPSN